MSNIIPDSSVRAVFAGSGRLGPGLGIVGAVLLLVGTALHPASADPNDPLAAFVEYAANQPWIATHLLQLFGVLLMGMALVLFSRRLQDGPAADWALLGMGGALASMALSAALQAVDGVALKAMVDRWAASPGATREAFFQAAVGVREIEIGLASMTSLLFGLTVAVYGIACWADGRLPRWAGAVALAGGVPTALAGLVIAYSGFSDLGMTINLAAGLLLTGWMIGLGVYWLRQGTAPARQVKSAIL